MVELAARHGFDMEGNSLLGSDDELYEETEQGSSASFMSTPLASGSGQKKKKRSRDHRGVKFEDMKRIFAVLVCCHYAHHSLLLNRLKIFFASQ
jgi:hypothetical protein